MRIGVVLLHYRHWPAAREAIEAVQAQLLPTDSLVVVDNASGDGSAAALAAAYPSLRLVEAERNDGYAAGMNLGRRALPTVDAVLFLTHECVVGEGALAALRARLERTPDVGVLGPLLGWRSRPEEVWSAGGGLGRRTGRPFHVQSPPTMAEWAGAGPQPCAWVDGAAALVRSTVLRDLGGFDEGYFLYDEELELALRARRLGWRVECLPAAVAWQEPGMAPPYLATRNWLRLCARVRGMRRFLLPAAVDLAGVLVRAVLPDGGSGLRRTSRLRLAGARDAITGRLDRDLADAR